MAVPSGNVSLISGTGVVGLEVSKSASFSLSLYIARLMRLSVRMCSVPSTMRPAMRSTQSVETIVTPLRSLRSILQGVVKFVVLAERRVSRIKECVQESVVEQMRSSYVQRVTMDGWMDGESARVETVKGRDQAQKSRTE